MRLMTEEGEKKDGTTVSVDVRESDNLQAARLRLTPGKRQPTHAQRGSSNFLPQPHPAQLFVPSSRTKAKPAVSVGR